MLSKSVLLLVASTSFVLSLPHHLARKEKPVPIVDLGYATYQGVRLKEAGVDQFLGMRYAASPLGHLRFRGPQDPIPKSGVQDASSVNSHN